MRLKIGLLAALLAAAFALRGGSTYASWAFAFVVYDGNVYVLSDEYVIPEQIGSKIGEVTKFSDREGTYSGNFSNRYPKGTEYYEIKGVDVREAIAVEESEGVYVKASYGGEYAGGRADIGAPSSDGDAGTGLSDGRLRAASIPYVLFAPFIVFIAGYLLIRRMNRHAAK